MAVEIEWIDSVSPASTGNKIYRDDVEIADIANGVQFYSDGTVDPSTEYKFEVQAHDGAGDETTQEVEGDNMGYITTEAPSNPELMDDLNAANYTNETDATAGFTNSSVTLTSVDVVDDASAGSIPNGTYCIKGVAAAAATYCRVAYAFPAVIGTNYIVKVWAKNGVGGTGEFRVWQGVVATPRVVITGTWTEYTMNVEANATTIEIRLYTMETGDATIGDIVYLDSLSIKEA